MGGRQHSQGLKGELLCSSKKKKKKKKSVTVREKCSPILLVLILEVFPYSFGVKAVFLEVFPYSFGVKAIFF